MGKTDLHDLPKTTVITDEIDPLHDEGVALAHKLEAAGVKVEAHDYSGVAHEFFGMGQVVGKAKQPEDVAIKNLKQAFGAASQRLRSAFSTPCCRPRCRNCVRFH